jgi:hypothetical protein
VHSILQSICNELDQIAIFINSAIPNDEPFNIAHGNWSFPGMTRNELSEAATNLSNLIQVRGEDEIEGDDARLLDYPRRLTFLRTNLVPQIWSNSAVAVPSYFATLDALKRAVEPALKTDLESVRSIGRVTARVRAMEARLNDLEPRSAALNSMVDRIVRAHDAADQLPTDLQSLSESRQQVLDLLNGAKKDCLAIQTAMNQALINDKSLNNSAAEAMAVIGRCETAYTAATSQGLAAAFAERSKALDTSMWAWVIGLVAALALGAIFGSRQLHDMAELMKSPSVPTGTILLNLILSLLSVGAPIWFGWLATKQVGQRFRLSEDYAFKASVSRAYEGYRREAARIDKDMEAQLLASALTRFDEQPLRLVESASHGSPWHELASSDLLRDALRTVPGFASQILAMAKTSLSSASSSKAKKLEQPTTDTSTQAP